MLKYKVCMLGAFAVGKTSLVQRYVHSIFSEKYQTTLGVKIDKKSLELDKQRIEFILWDLAGQDNFMEVRSSYLRGSSAAVLVADGTRSETLDTAIELKEKLINEVGEIPLVLVVNKLDLKSDWNIDQDRLRDLTTYGWDIIEASAMDSENVDVAFQKLAKKLISNQ